MTQRKRDFLSKKINLIFLVLIIMTIKIASSPAFITLGNYTYSKQRSEISKILYYFSWPPLLQTDIATFNLAQAQYQNKEYESAAKNYDKVVRMSSIENIQLKCDALIQYVNADLRQIEAELNQGKASQYRDRIEANILILAKCLEIDSNNEEAATNIALLLSALSQQQPQQQPLQQNENTDKEQEAVDRDTKAQREQRSFNEQDSRGGAPREYMDRNW